MEESLRLQKVRENAYTYLVKEVDPIISNCITYLLLKRPEKNVAYEMLLYLKDNIVISDDVINLENGLITKKEQRMYLATKISPVLTKLMAGLVQLQPPNVIEYLIITLDNMIKNNECIEYDINELDENNNNLPKPNKDNKRPLTSKGKLTDALNYDKSRISTSNFNNNNNFNRPGTAPELNRLNNNNNNISTNKKSQQIISEDNIENNINNNNVKTFQIALLGTAGSGKTSIVNSLQGNLDSNVKPTLGFRPTTMLLNENTKIKFYDIGGEKKIRDIWSEYYHDVHAVIYVIDSSIDLNSLEWDDIKNVFNNVRNHLLLIGKPFLIIFNKADLNISIDINNICNELNFNTDRLNNIIYCTAKGCSTTDSPISITNNNEQNNLEQQYITDKRLEQGIEWLLTVVNSNFDTLDHRVVNDTTTKARSEAKKRLERERKVLKNKIASVFYDSISDTLRPPEVDRPLPNDIYSEEEGINFLADEVGQKVDQLDNDAIEIAKLIGFQRLALQIVGALYAPISKKKTPMTWLEIKQLIIELRYELGL